MSRGGREAVPPLLRSRVWMSSFGLLLHGGEAIAHRFPPPKQELLRGGVAAAEHASDVGDREVVAVAEPQSPPLSRGEHPHSGNPLRVPPAHAWACSTAIP